MAPSMTLLQVEPDTTLNFCKTPTNTSPSRVLKLTNVSSGNVAFKVKTTAPKSYLVRPSSGTLRPRETSEVQIILQNGDGRVDHRFLVQAAAVASSTAVSREQWQEFSKDQVQEQRLNVHLEESGADTATAGTESFGSRASPATTVSAGGASMEAPPDLQQKYDELVQYTLVLEKQKKKLEAELLDSKSAKSSSDSGSFDTGKLIVAVAVFILCWILKLLGF
eukprot:TRINITY_DN86744_c0_g1_i1.p1 TRINITY_DN86744_c0_g1~~TRINITY_DN86744_c0_g1_i1.p1  ORF type:complete len:250 (+),score=42.05 TRINITY_DN86744_c0_g1_i1:86-751(+)